MKRVWLIILCLCFVTSCSEHVTQEVTTEKIYFVDSQLNRLIPYERDIAGGTPEAMAKSAIKRLIEGEDNNKNIRRLIPDISGCIGVSVKDGIAVVDISPEIKAEMPCSRDIEKLFIYQLVNTLTDIKGIRFVKFTVGGITQKEFMGFYDMREVYRYKYPE